MKAGGEDHVWFLIAEKLGGKTVAEWKSAMTYTEYLQWREHLLSIESANKPSRIDWGLAEIAHQIYLLPYTFFGNKKNAKLADMKDFLVKFEEPPKPGETPKVASTSSAWKAYAEEIAAGFADGQSID